MINFNAESTVRVAGSLFVDFSTITPPYDNLDIKFVKSTDSEIDNCQILANTFKARTIFRINSENATEIQSYLMGTPSSECYQFQHKKISFIIIVQSLLFLMMECQLLISHIKLLLMILLYKQIKLNLHSLQFIIKFICMLF